MAEELVHYQVRQGVATITLDSPHNRNALSAQLRRELADHLTTAIGDGEARVIVLDHTGPVFCAGMDLKEAGGSDAKSAMNAANRTISARRGGWSAGVDSIGTERSSGGRRLGGPSHERRSQHRLRAALRSRLLDGNAPERSR